MANWNNVDAVKREMVRDNWVIERASAAVRADYEFGLWAVAQNGANIQYLSADLQDNEAIAQAAISAWCYALQYVSLRLRANRAIVQEAACRYAACGVLQWADDALKADSNLMEEAIIKSQDLINLNYASASVRSDGALFTRLLNYCKETVGAGYWPRELIAYADASLLNDRAFVLSMVLLEGTLLEFASEGLRSDREIVQAAVLQCGNMLRYASAELKADREFVLLAAKNSNSIPNRISSAPEWTAVLQATTPALQDDEEIVLAAVTAYPLEFESASPRLRGDKRVVMEAVRLGASLSCVPIDSGLRANAEVIRLAIDHDGTGNSPLQFADDHLRDDRELVLYAVRKNATAATFASATLQEDPEIKALYANYCDEMERCYR